MLAARSAWFVGLLFLLAGCAKSAPRATSPAPCWNVQGGTELRTQDAAKTLDELAAHIKLAPDDEALRNPTSLEDIRAVIRRDLVYFFGNAAAYARSLQTLDGRISEATLELLMGESQLVASQVLTVQAAWVSDDLRVARALAASEQRQATSDRGRMLAQLVRVVEEGNKIADALGAVAPVHLARGAELIRGMRAEAKADPRTHALIAEYHRLRGEWIEFDEAMKTAEAPKAPSPALCYLRGMEQVERFRRTEVGGMMMRECLKTYPRFVRAEAALVLMAQNPRAALRELARLKAMNQDHYLVMLLEPTLAADQELSRMQRNEARDARP
jgi:hypothetical protein